MLRIGELSVTAVHDGTFALDGVAMFGLVPRPLWERELAPDARNRVRLALRCLLVRAPGRVALIDTGIGEDWPERLRDLYALDRSTTVLRELAARGVAPGDVTDVVLTHPHAPSERDRGSFRPETFAPLGRSDRLVLHDGPAEIFPGLRVAPTEGHTPALQVVVAGDGQLVYPADLLPTSAHLKLAWGRELRPEAAPGAGREERAARAGRPGRRGGRVRARPANRRLHRARGRPRLRGRPCGRAVTDREVAL